jgi:hypothetical protein
MARNCSLLTQPPSLRTTSYRLPATVYSIPGGRLPHPQPEDAPCRADRDPHDTVFNYQLLTISLCNGGGGGETGGACSMHVENKNTYKFQWENPKSKGRMGYLGVIGRIISKRIFEKYGVHNTGAVCSELVQERVQCRAFLYRFRSGAHPVSYPMGTRGSFPGGKAAGA